MRQIFLWTAIIFCTGIAADSGLENERMKLLDFNNPSGTAKYRTDAGVTSRIHTGRDGENFLEVKVVPFAEHNNRWPCLAVIGTAFGKPWDLTAYTGIEVKIQKVSEELGQVCTLLSSLTVNDGGRNFDYFPVLIPGGETMVQQILLKDIANPANDPSNLQQIRIMFPVTSNHETYRIISVEAYRNPAQGSIKDIIGAELAKAAGNLSGLRRKYGKTYPELSRELEALQDRVNMGMHSGFNGNYTGLRKELAGLNLKINAVFLSGLETELYAWHYPAAAALDDRQAPGFSDRPVTECFIDMARNEYRDATFMISAVRNDLNLTATLKVPEALKNYCSVFYTDYYFNYRHQYNAGDLVEPWTGVLKIPAGTGREVRVRAGGLDLPPGNYDLSLKLADQARNVELVMPVRLRVRPIKLADYPDNCCYAIFTAGNQAEAERHRDALAAMKRYGLNVVEVLPQTFNRATINENGEVVDFDSTFMDWGIREIAKIWDELPGGQPLIFQLFCHIAPELPKDPELHARGYLNWIGEVVKRLRSYGLDGSRFCLAFGDEASHARLLEVEIPRAELVKKHFPDVLTFQNSSQIFEDDKVNARYFAAFDIIAPNLDLEKINPFLFPKLAAAGKLKSTYKCRHMGGISADLYNYYRVYLWQCFKLNIPSAGVWTFNAQETGLFRQDQNMNNVGSAMVNRNRSGKIVNTRRYEVYRDGINDWRYLLTLRAVAGDRPERKARIERALAESVDTVLNAPADHDAAERQRLKIADMIVDLTRP